MKSQTVLHLNLRAEYFGQIARRTKRIEYREQKPYWRKRLEGRHYDVIQFRNGYATDAPEMLVGFLGLRRHGKGRNAYYAIRLGRILKIERWRKCHGSSILAADVSRLKLPGHPELAKEGTQEFPAN